MCSPCSELPSNISTMVMNEGYLYSYIVYECVCWEIYLNTLKYLPVYVEGMLCTLKNPDPIFDLGKDPGPTLDLDMDPDPA